VALRSRLRPAGRITVAAAGLGAGALLGVGWYGHRRRQRL
jgi:hypothetical protein